MGRQTYIIDLGYILSWTNHRGAGENPKSERHSQKWPQENAANHKFTAEML